MQIIKKIGIIVVCILLCNTNVYAKHISKGKLQQHKTIDSLNKKGFEIGTTNFRKVRIIADKAFALAENCEYEIGKAETYNVYATLCRGEVKYTLAFEYLNKAINIGLKYNNDSVLIRSYFNTGDLHKFLGNLQKADYYLAKALQLSKKVKSNEWQALCLSNFGHIQMEYAEQEKNVKYIKKAIHFFNLSLDVALKHKLHNRVIAAYINTCDAYHRLAKKTGKKYFLELSGKYATRAINFGKANNLAYGQGLSLLNLGELSETNENLDSAIFFYKQGLAVFESLHEKNRIIESHIHLANAYKRKGQNPLAAQHAFQVIAYGLYENRKPALQKGHQILAEIAYNSNDFKNAYKYEKIASAYRDSINAENVSVTKSGLLFQLENEQKDRRIFMLEKDNLINEQNAKTEKLYRNGLIAGCIVLALALVFIFLRFRERQKYANQILKSKEEAEQAKQAQEQFLANTSHEIRTPMNGVLGITQHLLTTPLDATQKEYLEVISKSTQDLLVIINDLLDVAKMKAGKINFENSPFQLKTLFDNITLINKGKLTEKNLAFQTIIDPAIPQFLTGDHVRVQQILLNLITNAIKFTDKGYVELEAVKEAMDDKQCVVKFFVRDTGVGIELSKQELIFESFTQIDSGSSRKYSGTGIGLTISKQLIEQMNGKIKLSSKPGLGTEICVTLAFGFTNYATPASYYAKTEKSQLDFNNALSGYKALVIDDNKVNLQVAKLTLNRWGINVTLANNGEEGVAKLLADEKIDIILMDLLMPGMDGFETTGLIRNHPSVPNKHIPIVAITASVIPGEHEKCLAHQMNGYISKPFNPGKLFDMLQKLLTAHRPASERLTDLTHLYEKAAGDNDFLKDIFNTYIEEMVVYVEELKDLIKQKNSKAIREQAHKMKSPVALFGAAELRDVLHTIELNVEQKGLTLHMQKELAGVEKMVMLTINEIKRELLQFETQ